MEESSTYQAIIREGEIRGGRKAVLRQGRARFGEPDAVTVAAIESIADLDVMERFLDNLREVASWADLLALAGVDWLATAGPLSRSTILALAHAAAREEGLSGPKADEYIENWLLDYAGANRRNILRFGTKRFGPPGARVFAEIEAISDCERLENMLDRVFDIPSWAKLIDPASTPTAGLG